MNSNNSTKEDITGPINMNYGKFKVTLADLLTIEIILRLATYFMYPPAKIDELKNTKTNAGQLMVSIMEERGQVQQNNISELLNALEKLKLRGLLNSVKEIFPHPEDKKSVFIRFLRNSYLQLYNKIQPIPYIRDKVYCVSNVFVEGGLEVTSRGTEPQQSNTHKHGSRPVNLTSHSDVFDDAILPSKRILLEGDPGYGKSTFTLQAAYDWSCGCEASPLMNCEVFILLQLRLLEGVSSIPLAIKLLLMPRESKLTDQDISDILSRSSSVVIILDGYDEYPDKGNGNDINDVIAGKMFANFKVITCTRSAYLPTNLDVRTNRVRLTGFDDKARDFYIKRAVVGNDEQAAAKINDLLTNSPVLSDICQVPLFCVMFAHIAFEENGTVSFTSVTTFIKYMLSCFYNHMWAKTTKTNDRLSANRTIPVYRRLNNVAFCGLTKLKQQIVWQVEDFKMKVGEKCYRELASTGILIEEETLDINNKPGVDVDKHIQKKTLVRFYHKLFAEWYAAIHLASLAGGLFHPFLRHTLQKINPFDLQFVFRFSCGMNKKAATRIVKYLRTIESGDSFASLCLFEQLGGRVADVTGIVRKICSSGVAIKTTDNRLLQRSNMQLLSIASHSKIPVPSLSVDISSLMFEVDGIILSSGVRLPRLLSVEVMSVTGHQRNITEQEAISIANYGQQCTGLKELKFQDCKMPLSLKADLITSALKSWCVTVSWIIAEYVFQLDMQTGHWEIDSIDTVKRLCSSDVTISKCESREKQRSLIQLLQIACRHNIRIPSLTLESSNLTLEDGITSLTSGVPLPSFSSMETFRIISSEEDGEMPASQMIEITRYGRSCTGLKEIRFLDCMMPISIDVDMIPPAIRSWNVPVSWRIAGHDFQLQLANGQWTVGDIDAVREMCSNDVYLNQDDPRSMQRYIIQLLENASNYGITITYLCIDESFSKVEGDYVILHSGLRLSCPLTVENVEIDAEGGREITEAEMLGILAFVERSQRLRELEFYYCLIPLSIPVERIPTSLKERNVKVSWRYFILNLQSGRLMNRNTKQEITDKQYAERVKKFREKWSLKRTVSVI